jgi:phosphopantothenoylcysteine decarboxylase/phosphopantothenate--cysteine ligase
MDQVNLAGRRVLLVITGGIAAYKSLELIRRLRERGCAVRVVMTAGACQFVTPLSVQALSEDKVYTELFSLTAESEMGHIRLSREADLLVVAPASADFMAKMATGAANDLASTVMLASDKPVLMAPAMNAQMWAHPAVQANVAILAERGVQQIGPDAGELACGEVGAGRMAEPMAILAAINAQLNQTDQRLLEHAKQAPLAGRHAIVTSGPTHEAIDPVRYIANRSSGKQGHAIAAALQRLGATTTLITGPTAQADPRGITVHHIESAVDMLAACEAALPADIAVCAAAVADWRVKSPADGKMKKTGNSAPPTIELAENPDILARLSKAGPTRPALVIGFAAETDQVVDHAQQKRQRKGCDWIVANDVGPTTGIFGGDENTVHLITEASHENWQPMQKTAVAAELAQRIVAHFADKAPFGEIQ